MQESEKEELIRRVADEVMRRLQAREQSLCSDTDKALAENILRRYAELSGSEFPTERSAAALVDAFLTDYASDPYIEAVRLFYCEGLTNAATARHIHCDDTTCRRNRSRLVRAFAGYIARKK